jgi:hypothetical protein
MNMLNQNIIFSSGAPLTIGASIPVVQRADANPTSEARTRPVTATTSVRPCVKWLSRWQHGALAIFAAAVDTPASWRDMFPNGLSVFEYADSALGAELWEVLHSDLHLAVFAYFHARPVLDSHERRLYEELLSDREIFAEMRQGLMFPGDDEAVMRGCIEWSLRIDYLEAALAWQDNPRRNELLGMIEEITAHNGFRPAMDESTARALTTIKLELVKLLSRHSPARVPQVLDTGRKTSMAALLEFLIEHTLMLTPSVHRDHGACSVLGTAPVRRGHCKVRRQTIQANDGGVPEALAFMETAAHQTRLLDGRIDALDSSGAHHDHGHTDDAVPVALDTSCDAPYQRERAAYSYRPFHGSPALAIM